MADGSVYQVNMVFTDENLGRVYRSGFQVEQDGPTWFPVTVAEAVISFWDDDHGTQAIKAWYPDEYELTRIEIRRVKELEDFVDLYTTGLPIQATSTADKLAAENSCLLSHRTDFIGRSRRGRTYLPAPNEVANASPGWWDSDFIGDVVNAWFATIGSLSALSDSMHQVVYSKKLDSAAGVTETRGDQRTRSQRRRNIKSPVYIVPSP